MLLFLSYMSSISVTLAATNSVNHESNPVQHVENDEKTSELTTIKTWEAGPLAGMRRWRQKLWSYDLSSA